MVQSYLLGLKRNDEQTREEVQAKFGGEFEVVAVALEEILRGLQEFERVKGKPDHELESSRLFLVTRSFNSLLTAAQVLERGYYQQALNLVRMAMEDGLVAIDIEQHPPTLAALLYDKGMIGKGELSYRKMAARLSPKAREVWDCDYGWLSKAAAHPRGTSLQGLVTVSKDGVLVLTIGGYYDEWEVTVVLYHLLREIQQVMAQVAKLMVGVHEEWITEAIPVQAEVEATWRQLDETAEDRMKGWRPAL